ncbi:MAG: hypothetical protein HC857_13250 [Synechococcales cyanobacterium RU_4_20]|nr:hypothetical protein [Synechococcales cyanobacterium RU_4_20]
MITSLGLAAMAALGTWTLTDGLYGGADVRAMRAQLEQLQQQNAELQQLQQQQRDAIAQAIGCQPGEGY